MGLELYMVGVIVENMPRAIEFYRRLGVEIPEGSESLEHVEVKMGSISFFLSTKTMNARWDPNRSDGTGGYRIVLEFYLKTSEAVAAKYHEMLAYGYKDHTAPFPTTIGMLFAIIDDPDGNCILLTGDLPKATESS